MHNITFRIPRIHQIIHVDKNILCYNCWVYWKLQDKNYRIPVFQLLIGRREQSRSRLDKEILHEYRAENSSGKGKTIDKDYISDTCM